MKGVRVAMNNNSSAVLQRLYITLFIVLVGLLELFIVNLTLYLLWDYGVLKTQIRESTYGYIQNPWKIPLYATIEELFFRKILMNLLKKSKIKYYNTIQAVLFGLFHVKPLLILTSFLFGLNMGNIYRKEKKILYPIFLHTLANTINLSVYTYMDYFTRNIPFLVIIILVIVLAIATVWKRIDMKLYQL